MTNCLIACWENVGPRTLWPPANLLFYLCQRPFCRK